MCTVEVAHFSTQSDIEIGDEGGRGARASPQTREKYFSGNYDVKFGHFLAKIT